MISVNSNSPSFSGIKYYNYNKNVINTYFNYRINCDGDSMRKVQRLINKQANNENHIILDYKFDEDKNAVIEKASVHGVEFVRRKFESVYSMLKRAAKYADSIKNKNIGSVQNVDRLSDFKLQVEV